MAGSGVNVKMGVTGVAQFKQSMNQAKQAVKTLDAQLALNEKQLKAGGDAEALMAEKSALLQAKLDNQKQAVASAEKALEEMAKNGVERSSKAYQDMYRTMLQAKGAMIDTESAMNGVSDSADAAADSATDMVNQLQQINRGVSLDNVTNSIGKIDGALTNAAKKAWQLGKAIVNEVLGAGTWADDLATRASIYGISPEQLQRMDKTSRLIDTSTESIINAQNKLKKGLGSGDKGVMGAYAELFGKGYNPNDKGWEQAFWDAGEAILKFKDAEEQEVYAQRLFGRSWHELVPLFEAGRKEYEEMNAAWNVVPQENIDALTQLDDKYQELQNELETVKLTFISELAPAVTTAMTTITDLLAKFNEYLASPEGKEAMKQLGDTFQQLVEDLVNVDPDAVVNALADAINKVKDALTWIDTHRTDVTNALKAIAIAFAGIKVANLATNIWSLVSGLGNLRGGGGGAPTVAPTVPTTPTTPTVPTTSPTTPVAPVIGTGAAGAAAKAGIGTKILSGLGAAAETATFLLPVALFVDGVVSDAKMLNAMAQKGEQSLLHFEEFGEKFQDSDYFNMWEQLSNYLTVGGDNYKRKQSIEGFAQHYMDWFNDEVQDAALDHLVNDLMTDEEYDKFHEAMEKVTSGGTFYNDEEREAFAEPLRRMLEIVEGEMEQSTKVEDAGKDITDAANKMEELPQKTANAVGNALRGVTINIDGPGLTTAVGGMMGGILASFNV